MPLNLYHIPRIFLGMYISWLSLKPRFSRLKFCGWRLSKSFRVFCALLQGYVRVMYATNLIEIDKTLYQIVYYSRGNPRSPCGKSWESGCRRWANQSGPITSPCLIKNNVQMHEMTRSTWPTVVSYFLKPTTFWEFLTSHSQFKVSPTRTDRFQVSPYNDPRTHLIKVKVAARVAAIYNLVYTTNSHAHMYS